jgi:transketolase
VRNASCQALAALFREKPFVFLTGDLGYKALEPLREAMGARFINAGVAEQNMVSVAAGLASSGLQAWAYSIAPFLYARPFEQIRNDVCLHDLDVKLVGNGGGYGYGPMGATHHALEDYGALLALQNMRAFVPAFAADVAPCVQAMSQTPHPCYLRLGLDERPADFEAPPYAPWRRLLEGSGPVLLVMGPLVGKLLEALLGLAPSARPELWVAGQLPLSLYPPSPEFLESLKRSGRLCVAEEHVAQGGLGQALAAWLLARGLAPRRFEHVHALGYPSKTYGSQAFHRKECGLDAAGILARIHES